MSCVESWQLGLVGDGRVDGVRLVVWPSFLFLSCDSKDLVRVGEGEDCLDCVSSASWTCDGESWTDCLRSMSGRSCSVDATDASRVERETLASMVSISL